MQAVIDYVVDDPKAVKLAELYLKAARPVVHADVLGHGVNGDAALDEEGPTGELQAPAARRDNFVVVAPRRIPELGGYLPPGFEDEADVEDEEDEDGDAAARRQQLWDGIRYGGRGKLNKAPPAAYVFLSRPKYDRNKQLLRPSCPLVGECNLMSKEIAAASETSFGEKGVG